MSASRSLMRTFAPCSESSSAVARPMPRADPVTIATLSSRIPMCRAPSTKSKGGNSRGMRLYPDLSRPRTRTIAGDAAVVLVVIVFAWLGTVVHDAVEELLAISDGVQSAGTAVEGAFRKAGDAVGGAPVVGGD